jgi:hypothetical protein
MISGYTSNKLDQVQNYNKNIPYQIGVNGVTNVTYSDPINLTGVTSVFYTIGSINYITNIPSLITRFFTNSSGYDFEPYIAFPNRQNTFDIKEEAKMKLVFPPKVSNEVFIERMSTAVFEKYSRLSEIKGLGILTNYRNGYYNIKQPI